VTAAETHLPVFEALRPRLTGLAYRMTGSLTDAEDIVQDAWLRWHRTDPASVDAPKPFLLRIVARLCLDRARSARARREVYVGPWLPEPVADLDRLGHHPGADHIAELADDLSVALLLVLERLSPLERAAFLLHDVFDLTFDDIASMLDRSPAACRKLASRARQRVKEARPARHLPREAAEEFASRFLAALRTGDVTAFARSLAEDAQLIADGGGKIYAALNPIIGRDRIVRFCTGLVRKFGTPREIRRLPLNGGEGFLIVEADGGLQTWTLAWNDRGLVQAIYMMRNPDKLGHLRRAMDRSIRDGAA
jgi:RNA polymerase sigma-70 factor, ECF subfamily